MLVVTLTAVLITLVSSERSYGDEFVVRIVGGIRTAKFVAAKNGYIYKGPVKGFENTYIFTTNHKNSNQTLNKRNFPGENENIEWIEEQIFKVRQKRDFSLERLQHFTPESKEYFNDELWNQEWYLKETGRDRFLKLDLNVLKVYDQGITGKGVRVSVLDDGLEYTHEDLMDNYDSEISYDCVDDDPDPLPEYDSAKTNNHGTRCAGEIAMAANNGKCGVGIAFNARIGGIRVLDGLITDRLEGTALSFGLGSIDIYSASWGPTDDGKTVDGPGKLAKEALERGIREGRRGKGSIFVWASGNGGGKNDNCNCDGYLNNIHTISIGSVNENGIFPWYGEACSSLMAVTYSSGARKDHMIVTTDLFNNCTVKHTGTSASAPLAAGIIALALEANSDLTWRDVQHLIVWSSEISSLIRNPGWQRNGIGLWFNNKFGFGLFNAFKLVELAKNWVQVPEKNICHVEMNRQSRTLLAFRPYYIPVFTLACKFTTGKEINYLEHVEIRTSIKYSRRGSLKIYLTSPSGTKVQLLDSRSLDHNSDDGFNDWSFMSVMSWGESPQGIWILTILDEVGPAENYGSIGITDLILHGTKEIPAHMDTYR